MSDIDSAIERAIELLDTLMDDARKAYDQDARKRVAFKTEYAKALLRVRAESTEKLTVDQVDAKATVETAQLRLEAEIAESDKEVAKQALRVAEEQLGGLRTLSAAQRGV